MPNNKGVLRKTTLSNRIFYTNITHRCNNHCRYCFDPATYSGQIGDMSLHQINRIIETHNIGVQDRFIINGGEPTLHPQFCEIVDSIKQTGCEIIMYTNGTKLSDLCSTNNNIVKNLDRITIPLHGDKMVHDLICQRNGAFSETINSIHCMQDHGAQNIELKIIVNEYTVQHKVDFIKVITDNNIDIDQLTGIVLTKMVDCDTSKAVLNVSNYNLNENSFQYVNDLLDQMMDSSLKYIKLLDFPLCKLNENIKQHLHNITINHCYNEFCVFDSLHSGRMIDYSKYICVLNKGAACSEYPLCSSILNSYYVLTYNREKNNWYYGWE